MLSDPSELAFDRGGWISVAYLAVPVLLGTAVCVGEVREERSRRERNGGLRRGAERRRREREREREREEEEGGLLEGGRRGGG